MSTLEQWAKVVAMDAAGKLDSTRSAALAELKKRANSFGQNLATFIEPALAVGTGLAGASAGGLVGAAGLPLGVDVAANAARRTQDWMTYIPRTEGGQKGMQVLGNAMGNLEQRVNTATGLASGALTYAGTGDLDKAMKVGGDVYSKGIGQAAGDAVLDKTGSPLLATGTTMIPDLVDAIYGSKLAGKIPGKQYEMGDIHGQAFGQKGTFGGIRAKNADLDAQAKAEKMLDGGASRDDIWEETGWFKDVDDSWKFEIDDSQMQLSSGGSSNEDQFIDWIDESAARESGVPISRAVIHEDLFGGYPSTKAIKMQVGRSGEAEGVFSAHDNSIGIKDPYETKGGLGTAKSTTAHELQHAIQEREGFAKGGSPDRMGLNEADQFKAAEAAYNASLGDAGLLAELGLPVTSGAKKPWGDLSRREQVEWLAEGRNTVYRRLAGEAEARNVQTRLNMTPEERKAKPPWQTLDVPESELIVKGSSGPAMSAGGFDIKVEMEKFDSENPTYWQDVLTKEYPDTVDQKATILSLIEEGKSLDDAVSEAGGITKETKDWVDSLKGEDNTPIEMPKTKELDRSTLPDDIGYADFNFNPDESWPENTIVLEAIQVNEKYRGKGYGRTYMQSELDKVFKENPDKSVSLFAQEFGSDGLSQDNLVGFYESMGFEVDDVDGVADMDGAPMTLTKSRYEKAKQ